MDKSEVKKRATAKFKEYYPFWDNDTQEKRIVDMLVDFIQQLQSSQSEAVERNAKIELLEFYSKYLEENGYMDTDWRTEEPFAIDEFLNKE